MIKKLGLILMALLMMTLAGCNSFTSGTTETTTQSQVQLIERAIEQFDFHDVNGFDFSSIQYLGEEVVNSDVIEQRVNWTDNKIYTEFTTSRVTEFQTESAMITDESVYFYYNNQMGTYVDDVLEWSSMSLDDYLDFSVPDIQLSTEGFSNYSLEFISDSLVLEAELSSSDIVNILGIDGTGVVTASITIKVNETTYELQELTITYEMNLTNTIIIFSPYYDSAQVVIPE